MHLSMKECDEKMLTDIKWGASSAGVDVSMLPMQNSDEMTIGKTHPTLLFTEIDVKHLLSRIKINLTHL